MKLWMCNISFTCYVMLLISKFKKLQFVSLMFFSPKWPRTLAEFDDLGSLWHICTKSIATESISDSVTHSDCKLVWSHWKNPYSWQVETNYFQLTRWVSLHSFFEIIWTLELFSTVWMLPIINNRTRNKIEI